MTLWQTLLTAVSELALHKFRSALATLGIIFGVASVLAMLSIGEGAKRETLDRIAILGVDNVILRTVRPQRTTQQNAETDRSGITRYGLLRDDLKHVRETFAGLRYVVAAKLIRETIYPPDGREVPEVKVVATEPGYLNVTRSTVRRGRFLIESDLEAKRGVCVVGVAAARKLFSFAEPLGQTLRIGGDYVEVVGLLGNAANLKDAGGDDVNNLIYIPLTTAADRYGDTFFERGTGSFSYGSVELDAILIQVADSGDVEATARRARAYLSRAHRSVDYDMLVPRDLLRQKAATQRIFTVVLASIAGISLLVGGIGIMNIMLANVSDRRREIGTRRALGARRLDIVRQFLLEAAALTTFGGVIGVVVGYVLSKSVSAWATWPVVITVEAVVLGLAVSCLSGLIFGLWPAWQAAKVNPIEALRAG